MATEKKHFDKIMMMFVLYLTNAVSWICIVLHWNNSLCVDISLQSDTIFWFHSAPNKFDVWQHLVFSFKLSISLLLWKDKINTEINASVDLLYTLARGPLDVEALPSL